MDSPRLAFKGGRNCPVGTWHLQRQPAVRPPIPGKWEAHRCSFLPQGKLPLLLFQAKPKTQSPELGVPH